MTSRPPARPGRRRGVAAFLAGALPAAAVIGAGPAAAQSERFAYSTALTGVIDRAAERGLDRTITDARDKGAAVLIIRMDTPGGLAQSTRTMIQDILAAPMPVIVYAHPSGARADSAGMFMMLAADVAAMAPATNIGSATPVRPPVEPGNRDQERIMRALDRKFLNDSVAFARSLAEQRGRNADLAERMVRAAQNVTAARARRERLVDVIAPSEQELLRTVDGFQVKGRRAQRLQTAGLSIRHMEFGTLDFTVEDVDNSSFWRSLALIGGGAMTLALLGIAAARGPRSYRRWKRRRRARSRRQA